MASARINSKRKKAMDKSTPGEENNKDINKLVAVMALAVSMEVKAVATMVKTLVLAVVIVHWLQCCSCCHGVAARGDADGAGAGDSGDLRLWTSLEYECLLVKAILTKSHFVW